MTGESLLNATYLHFKAVKARAEANLEVYLTGYAGVAEHPDTLETIEKELAIIAEYDDQLEMLNKYFTYKDPLKSQS